MIEDAVGDGVVGALETFGHEVRTVAGSARSAFGLGQVIQRTNEGVLWAGSDPRGDGCVIPAQ
jgi:gamma-glutamyltranspeptidase/glutathione hydrolase